MRSMLFALRLLHDAVCRCCDHPPFSLTCGALRQVASEHLGPMLECGNPSVSATWIPPRRHLACLWAPKLIWPIQQLLHFSLCAGHCRISIDNLWIIFSIIFRLPAAFDPFLLLCVSPMVLHLISPPHRFCMRCFVGWLMMCCWREECFSS